MSNCADLLDDYHSSRRCSCTASTADALFGHSSLISRPRASQRAQNSSSGSSEALLGTSFATGRPW